jgi:uncharacterized membrane protein
MSETNRIPQSPAAPSSTEDASVTEPLPLSELALTPQPPPPTVILNAALQRIAVFCLFGLFLLCVLWEIWLAPLKPGGTLLFLKALPLAFAMRGTLRGSLYTIQWASMLVLLYLMEGVVRVMSDPPGPSIALAWVEIVLATGFFFSSVFYVRPAKKVAKALQKAEKVKK